MIALGTVLSLIKLVALPYGGSITVAHMLPVILIAYRYGSRWGFAAGTAYGLLQMLLGLNNLSYATSIWAGLAILLFDYILAYAGMGLAGFFRPLASQKTALVCGSFAACLFRYGCHTISGCTVWAGLSVPTAEATVFSLIYNATYMIPETLVTLLFAFYLGHVFDFKSDKLTRISASAAPRKARILRAVGGLSLCAAVLTDICCIFRVLQNPDEGTFSFSALKEVPWTFLGLLTAAGICIFILLLIPAKKQTGRDVSEKEHSEKNV